MWWVIGAVFFVLLVFDLLGNHQVHKSLHRIPRQLTQRNRPDILVSSTAHRTETRHERSFYHSSRSSAHL